MLKALFSIAFGLTFGAVLLFVGLLASSAFAAPPFISCNGAGAEKLQAEIDAASEGDVLEVKGDCAGVNYVIATNGLTLGGHARLEGSDVSGNNIGRSPCFGSV